ncbi:multicopper oxidase domain-containing protein [Modestobacter lapidis]|nr:multicopper oxidase domain-containing protein [Modestobacter lapidis]
MNRDSWHLRAGAVIAAWLAALVAVALAHPFVPAPRWLLVHLLVLGAASNAILLWSWHFAGALLRLEDEATRRGQAQRIILFNAGALAVVAGVLTAGWGTVVAGGVAVAGAATWHAVALLRAVRAALPSRFGVTIRYYVAAGALLPVGVAFGVVIARGTLGDVAHGRVVVAHEVLNLLGWIGLTVLGTLVTLWPTMLRTRIAPGVEERAARMLPVLVGGLILAAGGALLGSRPAAAAGVLVYLGGLVGTAAPHRAEVRRKVPADFATLSVLAGMIWLAGSLVALAVAVGFAGDWVAAADRAARLTAPLLAGFAAQVLLGALTYLVPMVLGRGPAATRAAVAVLDRGSPARIVMVNGALLLAVLPVPGAVRVLASAVVLVGLAGFLPLAGRAVVLARRIPTGPPGRPGPPPARSGQRRAGLAAAGLAVVLVTAAAGVAVDPAAVGIPGKDAAAGVEATGRTTIAQVEMHGMRFAPASLSVPAGNRLVIELTNHGDQPHDLVLENGARTPRLAPGASTELDAGVVGGDLDGWCSVAGHRQMGMVLVVRATGGDQPPVRASPGAEERSAADDLDLEAAPSPGFVPHDAVLPPVPEGTTHRITLEVTEEEREVAPGVTQTRWLFGGSAPGPTLHGRVGDVFEITLVNSGTMGHSIDFHAGELAPEGPMRTIGPRESLTYRFTATHSGIWLYHCSTMPMSLHVANGMFGAVVIDPPDLPPVDREYVLVQSELYLGPDAGTADADRVRTAGPPDLVVFNGYADQYDAAPLPARVGERVRIWVLDAGPNRSTAFHVVGGQFDTVYREGAYDLRPDGGNTGGSQALGLMPAQGGFVELAFPEPGSYPFVSHLLADAERGGHGLVRVGP